MRLSHFCQLILRSKSTQINYYKCREGGITTKTMVVAFPLFYEHVLCYCSTNKFHDKMSSDAMSYADMSYDEMSVWQNMSGDKKIFRWRNVRLANFLVTRCLCGQMPMRPNIPVTNCPGSVISPSSLRVEIRRPNNANANKRHKFAQHPGNTRYVQSGNTWHAIAWHLSETLPRLFLFPKTCVKFCRVEQ